VPICGTCTVCREACGQICRFFLLPSRSALRQGLGQEPLKGTSRRPTRYIVVDKYGRRYTNEDFRSHTVYYELHPL